MLKEKKPKLDGTVHSLSLPKKLLVMVPRILGILFILFISIFAFDVFEEEGEILSMVLAFLIHLIPSYILIVTLLFAWRFELLGAIIYFGLSLLYVIITNGKQHWGAYLSISGTSLVLGILFLLDWIIIKRRRNVKKQTGTR